MLEAQTYIGLDSDGCVLDTMAAKQHAFLQPLFVETFGLEAVADIYYACADFVNLYSETRGITRFKAILLNLNYFNKHPELLSRGGKPIDLTDLRAFVESGLPMGEPALAAWLKEHPSSFLEKVMQWSQHVNAAILASKATFPAYHGAREALIRMHGKSRLGIVSQSPERVLKDDWGKQDLLQYVDVVEGQEVGDKVVQLQTLAAGADPMHVLMIGDAPGDLAAARTFGARFYPILPGQEESSWDIFNAQVYPAFQAGLYTKAMEAHFIASFHQSLPASPAWCQS